KNNQKTQIVKDIHLIWGSLGLEKVNVSLDENTARRFFNLAAQTVTALQTIAWVNPDRIKEETPIAWLEHGATLEKSRLLGCNLTEE
ncbi:MAG: hypothetical protein F6K31_36440, partial [Symploca sp. SIO2G7]|nr:hypothetical protein [Symploca sp. SIO2G7]